MHKLPKELLPKELVYLKDYFEMNDIEKARELLWSVTWRYGDEDSAEFEDLKEELGSEEEDFDSLCASLTQDQADCVIRRPDKFGIPCEHTLRCFDLHGQCRLGWLCHFTDTAPYVIAREGFRGETEMWELHTGGGRKRSEYALKQGYAFAFTAKQVDQAVYRGQGRPKYGTNAIMFRAPYLLMYHYGDNEKQAVFWTSTARDFVELEWTGEGWRVKPLQRAYAIPRNWPVFSDVQDAAQWVEDHADSYRRPFGLRGNPRL